MWMSLIIREEDLQLSEMIILNTFLFLEAYLGKKILDLSAANKVG